MGDRGSKGAGYARHFVPAWVMDLQRGRVARAGDGFARREVECGAWLRRALVVGCWRLAVDGDWLGVRVSLGVWASGMESGRGGLGWFSVVTR